MESGRFGMNLELKFSVFGVRKLTFEVWGFFGTLRGVEKRLELIEFWVDFVNSILPLALD